LLFIIIIIIIIIMVVVLYIILLYTFYFTNMCEYTFILTFLLYITLCNLIKNFVIHILYTFCNTPFK